MLEASTEIQRERTFVVFLRVDVGARSRRATGASAVRRSAARDRGPGVGRRERPRAAARNRRRRRVRTVRNHSASARAGATRVCGTRRRPRRFAQRERVEAPEVVEGGRVGGEQRSAIGARSRVGSGRGGRKMGEIVDEQVQAAANCEARRRREGGSLRVRVRWSRPRGIRPAEVGRGGVASCVGRARRDRAEPVMRRRPGRATPRPGRRHHEIGTTAPGAPSPAASVATETSGRSTAGPDLETVSFVSLGACFWSPPTPTSRNTTPVGATRNARRGPGRSRRPRRRRTARGPAPARTPARDPRRARTGAHRRSTSIISSDFCAEGGGHLDADTGASAASWEAALLAAGSGLEAVDAPRTRRRRRRVLRGPAARSPRGRRTARWASACSTTSPSPRRRCATGANGS